MNNHSDTTSPTDWQIQLDKALELHAEGKLDKAKKIYENILDKDPKQSLALVFYGVLLHEQNHSDLGLQQVDNAIAMNGEHPGYHYNRGLILKEMGRYCDAIASYQRCIELNPNFPPAFNNLGNCWKKQGEFETAIECYRQALTLDERFIEAHINMGLLYAELSQHDAARRHYHDALSLSPNCAAAHEALGKYYSDLQDHEKAIEHFKIALSIEPNHFAIQVSLFSCYQKVCDWDELEALLPVFSHKAFSAMSKQQLLSIDPFEALALPLTAAQQLKVAKAHADDIKANMQPFKLQSDFSFSPCQTERIRVGYLSADFCNHTVGHLIHNLFRYHNRNEFEIFAYAMGKDDQSFYRKTINRDCEHFIDLSQLSYQACAKKIYQDNIQILIDLTTYTKGGRLPIMALRPAPIQIQYLGFLGSTGADFIDYVITDQIITPPESQADYTEKFIYMPDCYQVNSQQLDVNQTTTRQEQGLPDNAFIFASFNNNYKIDLAVFKVWMNLLLTRTQSILWILADSNLSRKNILNTAKRNGVSSDRIYFANKVPRAEHLARHHVVDLYLDTLNVNARTSASDALLTGLPILTCLGKICGNRVGASLLTALGLPELIAKNIDDYIAKALYYVDTPQALRDINNKLANHIKTHPLFDTKRFVYHLERHYRALCTKQT